MKKQGIWILLILATLTLAFVFTQSATFLTASSLNRDAAGWFLARRYLESQDVDVRLLDRPLATQDLDPKRVLVLVQPFQLPLEKSEKGALQAHLRDGGKIIVAYSGQVLAEREEELLASLELQMVESRGAPPILPWRWWSYRREQLTLKPVAVASEGRIQIPAPRRIPRAPERARVLYAEANGEERALIFDYRLHDGRVIAMPAAVFANAGLSQSASLDLLTSLALDLGGRWDFDEYHHRYLARDLAEGTTSSLAWDVFLLHLALVYLLALFALGRRFGPPWQETFNVQGSTAAFLRRLGTLHHRLGHHREAARHLVERARSLDDFDKTNLPSVDKPSELVQLAREVAQRQRRRSFK